MMKFAALALAIAIIFAAVPAGAQGMIEPSETFAMARVIDVRSGVTEEVEGMKRTAQTITLRIESGPDVGKEITVENGALEGRNDTHFAPGQRVVVERQTKTDGSTAYLLREPYRLPSLFWLLLLFIVLGIAFGGKTGVTSIAGLAVSIGILIGFVIPRIIAGADPLITSLVGCIGIACTSLYLAHGFNRRTSIALLSTAATLGIAALLDVAFVRAAGLFGMGSEESLYLQSGMLANVDLRGLLLGGILIGCLGVLDDVTTAQTAAIDEISKANPAMGLAALRRAGQSVGREHIASLINTLALAYVGASLPLLLLLKTQGDYPLWIIINGEFFAEEIVRTLVGSTALLIAVPVSTAFAAYFLQGGRGRPVGSHSHADHMYIS